MDKKDIYLWLKSIDGIGDKTIDKIEEEVGSISQIVNLSEKEILKLKNINSNITKNIVKCKSHAYIEKIKNVLKDNKIEYISIDDEKYPKKLREIYNPPKILFYRGDISILNENINLAMVGSRKASSYGRNIAKNMSKQLSDIGINIVSGLATGIDSFSHVGCMEGKSKTIAILGSSVDNPLPKSNLQMANKIIEQGGVLISEFYPNSNVIPSNFYNRNRIISGISDGVIVVEAASRSGALITVEFALEQGKNIFAVPGNITSEMSKGCHKIIKEGAILLDNIEDIIKEYNIDSNKLQKHSKNYDDIGLDEESNLIIHHLKKEGTLQIDAICDYTDMEIKNVNTILNKLALCGLIIEGSNNTYSLSI